MRAFAALVLAASFLAPVGATPLGVPVATGAPWGVWTTELVDALDVPLRERYVFAMNPIGMELDSAQHPHVLYPVVSFESGRLETWYAKSDGVTWTRSRVLDATPGGLAVDSQSRGHYSAYDGGPGPGDLVYGKELADGSFTRETVVHVGGPGVSFSTVLLDASESPHIIYVTIAGDAVRHAYKSGGAWQTELIATGVAISADVAVDSEDRIHVVFSRTTFDGTIGYAVHEPGGAWTVAIVPGCNEALGLDVDGQGRPHVSCFTFQGLAYLHRNGAAWQRELLVDDLTDFHAPDDMAFSTDIGLDAAGNPHITYVNYYNVAFPDDPFQESHLRYASKVAGLAWSYETIDRILTANAPGIAIDNQGRPHVAYEERWVVNSLDESVVNPYFKLWYAQPAVAAATPFGV